MHPFVAAGATPFNNWGLVGPENVSSYQPFDDRINKYVVRRVACANCPIGCGGILRAKELGIGEFERLEYETTAGFGPNCLNNDLGTILKANDICNRYGVDTISVGASIAFAVECYEQGIISKQDTDGIELTWGNTSAMIAMLEKIAKREGFGALLADGLNRADAENWGWS